MNLKLLNNLNNLCRDSICSDPKLVLGSNVKGPNNKICREWAKRLGLGYWTVVSHGVRDDCTGVNYACPRRFFSSTRSGWLWFLALAPPAPPYGLLPSLFILAFTLPPKFTCRSSFLGLILVLSTHTQSGWGWL